MSGCALILYCNCGYYDLVAGEVKARILSGLAQTDVQFEAVQDLCELAVRKDPRFKRWTETDGLKIIACFPRAVKWLFHAAGATLGEDVEFLNLRSEDVEKIIASLDGNEQPSESREEVLSGEKGDWTPWFPLIDYDRCKNCMQCLNFCLFGVYEVSEDGRVSVAKPANCKTNCPACARACPQRAIIFPKYTQSPINGDQVEELESGSTAKAGLSELANGDILENIRRHGKARKRFARDADRQGATTMQELCNKLDIPKEVLAALSPADMARLKQSSAPESSGGVEEQDP